MKKIVFLIVVFILFTFFIKAQTFTLQSTNLTGVYNSSVAWGDYNNNGTLDILLTGYYPNEGIIPYAEIYTNNGNGSFNGMSFIPNSVYYHGMMNSSVAWSDFNNDGYLDILLTGTYSNIYPWVYPISTIYQNNTNGTFTETNSGIVQITNGSVAVGDYDNDGYLDILITGDSTTNSYSGVVLTPISRIYKNNKDGTFTQQTNINLPGVDHSSVAWGDYNNDGYLDILLTGINSSGYAISKIYKNNGDGTFTEQTNINLTGNISVTAAWGDYNNDGYLDILLSGGGYTKIYKNNGDGTFTEQTNINLVGLSNCSAAWGDYNNDGHLDILITGDSIHYNPNTTTPISYVYKNIGDSIFNQQTSVSLTGVDYGSVAWGDYNNDGHLDILLTGKNSSGNPVSQIYKNNDTTTNLAPSIPSNLQYNPSLNMLHWNRSTDDHTPSPAISYNVAMGDASNPNRIKSAQSNISTGFRSIVAMGNVQLDTFCIIKYNFSNSFDSIYYLRVQAIDNALKGSAFSTPFQITNSPLGSIVNNDTTIICGSAVQVNVSVSNGNATNLSYSWTPSIDLSDSTIQNPIASPSQTTLYKVVATAQNGLSFTDSIKIIVNHPVINSPSTGTICSGAAQNYTMTSTLSGTTYNWARAAVAGISNVTVINQTSSTITEALTNTTISPINVIYLITPAINGCTGNTFTYTVTVNPTPANAGTITGTATVCQGQSSVTYNVPTIANATSYIWTLPIGSTGSSDSNSIIINYTDSAVSGNIAVYGNNSCSNGTSSTLAITVKPIVANAGIISGTTTVCQGQSSVTYTVPAINNATSYIWTFSGGDVTDTSSTNHITIDYSTTAVSSNLTVKGLNSCGIGDSSVLSIIVNPLPTNAGTITGLAKVCQGQNSLTYSIPIIDNATSYIWTLPNGAIGSSDSNSIIINYDISYVSGIITVKGTNSCGNGISSSLSVIRHIPDTIPICYVEYDTLTQKNKIYWSSLSSNTTDSVFIYTELTLNTWSKIGSTLYSNQSFVDSTSDPMNQSYSYKISGIDTCDNESVKSSNHKTITLIKSYDQLSNTYGFSWSGYEGIAVPQYNVYGVDANSNATIIGTVPGNSLMYNYTNPNSIYVNYFVGFNITPCASKSTHTVRSNYVVSVTAGIAENGISLVKVYPNPTKDNLTIETNLNTQQKLVIINLIGQTVYTSNINKKAIINTSAFANGVYILKLSSDKETIVRKFVKE